MKRNFKKIKGYLSKEREKKHYYHNSIKKKHTIIIKLRANQFTKISKH